jgi:predicted DNA-binding protein (MmcQ/YjbR family)
MLVIAPEILDLLEQTRQVALSYADTEENSHWGIRSFIRERKGRNFLFANEQKDHLGLDFRVPLEDKATALALPFVALHKSMGSRGWLTARVRTEDELEAIIPLVRLSYELAKPFRRPEEALPGEAPEVLDFLEQVRRAAFSYEDVEEYFPYGDRAFRSRKGQIFLYASEYDSALYVNVRLPFGEREFALSLPNAEIPKYIGHKGWVGLKASTQDELDMVLPWIDLSYQENKPRRKVKAKK